MNILRLFITPSFFYSVLRISTPLVFGTISSYTASKAGLSNIAIEGMMLISALLGVVFSATFGMALPAFLLVVLIGACIGFAMGFMSEILRAKIFLTGLALNMIASGTSVFLLFLVSGDRGASTSLKSYQMPAINIPIIQDIPVIGTILSGHNVLTYVAYLSVIVIYIFINKTKIGLRIRAVGINEQAAKSVGVKALNLKLLALSISGALAAMGGAYLSMGYLSIFTNNMTAGRGFISLSADAMSAGSALIGMLVALLFGVADSITNWAQQSTTIPVELIQTIPYVFVILALVLYNLRKNAKAKRNEMSK